MDTTGPAAGASQELKPGTQKIVSPQLGMVAPKDLIHKTSHWDGWNLKSTLTVRTERVDEGGARQENKLPSSVDVIAISEI